MDFTKKHKNASKTRFRVKYDIFVIRHQNIKNRVKIRCFNENQLKTHILLEIHAYLTVLTRNGKFGAYMA